MTELHTEVGQSGVLLVLDGPAELPLGTAVRDLARNQSEAQTLHLLDELWADGSLERIDTGKWLIPFERLLDVDEATSRILALPSQDSTTHVELRSRGIATSSDFEIWVDLTHPVFGRLDPNAQSGPAFLMPSGECVLLTPALWKLMAAIRDAPPADAPTEDRFEYLSQCVTLARSVSAEIDGYLSENALEIVSDIGLEVTEQNDELHIAPKTDDLDAQSLLLPNGKARPFPTRTDATGKRRRVVSSSAAREKIEQIATNSILHGTDVPKFLQNPEAFLPEGMDLSDFSERVRGFRTRVYNSRPYLHVPRKPGGWLDFEDIKYGVRLDGNVDGEAEQEITADEYRKLADQAEASGERFVKHEGGWIEVDSDQASQFIDTTDRIRSLEQRGQRLSMRFLLDVIPNIEILEFEVDLPEDAYQPREWKSKLPIIEPPGSLNAKLDKHQLLGFRWLSYLNSIEAGGLLADEMGVGKTLQVIALFAKLFDEGRLSPALVVLPKTLIPNWQTELTTFAPGIDRLHVHSGSHRTRSAEFLSSMNVVITTYDTARQDQLLLGSIDWTVVVADEAQFVKNPTAARTSVVKAMKAKQALALTGTPVENGLLDFWCIMDFVQPGLLRSWSDFRNVYERPVVQATDPSDREELVEQLLSKLDPHFLRRLKSEVLADLPPKNISAPDMTKLSLQQRQMYSSIIANAKAAGRGAILGAITKLLILCSHPRAHTGDWDTADGSELIAECPKLQVAIEVLEKVKAVNEKALIFTNWKATQKILQRAIWSHFDVTAEIVNGDITSRRQTIIDQFRQSNGFNVLILAPEVAGFGLNLIEANHVIHYTRPWNPAKENQATDRVHRRGQERPVTVYYPTVEGTVEERLAELLASKSQLAQDVLRPTQDRIVTAEELLNGVDLAENA